MDEDTLKVWKARHFAEFTREDSGHEIVVAYRAHCRAERLPQLTVVYPYRVGKYAHLFIDCSSAGKVRLSEAAISELEQLLPKTEKSHGFRHIEGTYSSAPNLYRLNDEAHTYIDTVMPKVWQIVKSGLVPQP
jgi:hypothetical protein